MIIPELDRTNLTSCQESLQAAEKVDKSRDQVKENNNTNVTVISNYEMVEAPSLDISIPKA